MSVNTAFPYVIPPFEHSRNGLRDAVAERSHTSYCSDARLEDPVPDRANEDASRTAAFVTQHSAELRICIRNALGGA